MKKISTKIFEKYLKHRQREEVPSSSTNLVQSDHQVHNQYRQDQGASVQKTVCTV